MNTHPIVHLRLLLLVALLACPLSAWCMELDDAKQQGLVGEQADGYLGIVTPNPSAAVTALVDEVNGKRRAEYQRIATQNDITMADVEALAGRKTIEKTPPGYYIKPPGSAWRKK